MTILSVISRITVFYKSKGYINSLLLFSVVTCVSCVHTKIENDAINRDLVTLAYNLPESINVKIDCLNNQSNLGNQYILLGIPIGNIEIEDPKTFVWRSLYKNFALNGLRPIAAESDYSFPMINICVTEFTSNAFDLLFIRRLVSTLNYQATYYRSDLSSPVYLNDRFSVSSWELKAFKPEIEHSVSSLLDNVMKSLIDVIKIPAP